MRRSKKSLRKERRDMVKIHKDEIRLCTGELRQETRLIRLHTKLLNELKPSRDLIVDTIISQARAQAEETRKFLRESAALTRKEIRDAKRELKEWRAKRI